MDEELVDKLEESLEQAIEHAKGDLNSEDVNIHRFDEKGDRIEEASN